MLDTLKQKILSWTPEKADQFHGNLLRYDQYSSQIWERTPTGYFLYSPWRAEYRDYNGDRRALYFGDQQNMMNFRKELSDLADTLEMSKIEKPTKIELVDFYNLPYTYVEWSNPVPMRGIPLANLFGTTDFRETALSCFKKYFKESDNLISAIDQLIEDRTQHVYPEVLSSEMLCYDDTTDQFFWSGDIELSRERELVIQRMNQYVEYVDVYTVSKTSLDIKDDIINYVDTECTTFRNL